VIQPVEAPKTKRGTPAVLRLGNTLLDEREAQAAQVLLLMDVQ
jgi:hypothetical protein